MVLNLESLFEAAIGHVISVLTEKLATGNIKLRPWMQAARRSRASVGLAVLRSGSKSQPCLLLGDLGMSSHLSELGFLHLQYKGVGVNHP